jgi:predicted anti-sigma-YlaC factor YlaD
MNLTCDVVQDLVSIYKDGAASAGTAAAVEAHLKQCGDCRRYYRQYDSINRKFNAKLADIAGDPDNDYMDISAALKTRRMIAEVFIAVCAAITVTSVVFAFLIRRKK